MQIKWNSQGEALIEAHKREAIETGFKLDNSLGPLHYVTPEHCPTDPNTGKVIKTGKGGAPELWFGDKLVGNLVADEPKKDEPAKK